MVNHHLYESLLRFTSITHFYDFTISMTHTVLWFYHLSITYTVLWFTISITHIVLWFTHLWLIQYYDPYIIYIIYFIYINYRLIVVSLLSLKNHMSHLKNLDNLSLSKIKNLPELSTIFKLSEKSKSKQKKAQQEPKIKNDFKILTIVNHHSFQWYSLALYSLFDSLWKEYYDAKEKLYRAKKKQQDEGQKDERCVCNDFWSEGNKHTTIQCF